MDKYFVKGKEASKLIGVHQRTLMNWDAKGIIETKRTPGNARLYEVSRYLESNDIKHNICSNLDDLDNNERLNICYVRVSSKKQEDDLIRQKEMIFEKYPDYKIIEEIGSGMNLTKKGIKKIIHLAINGKINKLVIAHKDRLARFGYDLIEDLIKTYSNGEIIIVGEKENITVEEELVKDVMSIMNVYVAKLNGLRKYKKL